MGGSFRDLTVWKRSIELTLVVYKLTSSFPDSERFGLTNQLRRASVSVASNIAEGYGRSTKGEYVLFLGHARGSISEVETQLVISKALGFGSRGMLNQAEELCAEVGKMLRSIMTSLKGKSLVPRAGCINIAEPSKTVPQGLKPFALGASRGTAEAVPFQNAIYATGSSP